MERRSVSSTWRRMAFVRSCAPVALALLAIAATQLVFGQSPALQPPALATAAKSDAPALPPPAGPATRDTQPPTSNVAPTLPPPTASPTAPPQKLKSQPPKQSEDLATALDRPGDLNLKGLSLEAALFTISEQWNINIVTGELKGTVNGVFKQAPLREILDAILLSNGYNYRQVGKSLVISSTEQLGQINPFFQ